LVKHFLQRSAKQLGVEPKRISEAALQRLAQFSFPGNVRQLENVCHWLTVMAPAQQISVQDLPPEVLRGAEPEAANAKPIAVTAPIGMPVPEGHFQTSAAVPAQASASPSELAPAASWEQLLESDARKLLQSDCKDVWDVLSQRFESSMIVTALSLTHGKRMEAAQRLGIGRNTITRKIQELGLDSPD
jgi:two-component system nitrogen regulation response regulator GlnG